MNIKAYSLLQYISGLSRLYLVSFLYMELGSMYRAAFYALPITVNSDLLFEMPNARVALHIH